MYILCLITVSCNRDVKNHNLTKQKDGIETKNNNLALIGCWRIDSMVGSVNIKTIKIDILQGYLFKNDGKVFLFEKTDNKLIEKYQGSYRFDNQLLTISDVNLWDITNLSARNFIMTNQKELTPNIGKPTLYLTKIKYSDIQIEGTIH